MKRVSIVLAATLAASGCSLFGGGGGGGNQAAPAPTVGSVQPSAAPSGAPAPPPPQGAQPPMNPVDYRGPTRSTAPAAPPAAAGNSLFNRLGGLDAIRAVVKDFANRVVVDPRINTFFRGVDGDNLERLLVEQICEASGGPCRYSGRSMPVTHQGMNLTDAHFNALVEDLAASLDQFNVPAREKTELLTLLATMRGDIVGK